MGKQLKRVFKEADTDGSGTLSWREFEAHLKDERIVAYLSSLELDVSEAHGLFRLLDIDNTQDVGIEDFIMGCMRLKGNARSIDVCTLLYETRRQSKKWQDFRQYVEGQFDR